jgi:hypothetical protein
MKFRSLNSLTNVSAKRHPKNGKLTIVNEKSSLLSCICHGVVVYLIIEHNDSSKQERHDVYHLIIEHNDSRKQEPHDVYHLIIEHNDSSKQERHDVYHLIDISDYFFLDLLKMCNANIDGKYPF